MILKAKRQKLNNGFTIIEALTVLFIFSVTVFTFYETINIGLRHIADAKNRLEAIALADEKMEIIRNLSYDNIGVQGGIPGGNIDPSEDIIRVGKNFHVDTFVQYIDDPFDGTEDGSPDDIIPFDYKRAKVAVSWNSATGATSEVSLVSRFVPPGLESGAGKGTLAINVLDDHNGGAGVPQVNVHIVNNTVSPHVDIETETDASGHLIFPGADPSDQSYKITVSKSGYESATTLDPYPINAYDPDNLINASVIAGSLNPKDILISRLGDLDVHTVDPLGNDIPDIDFHITGGRIIGYKVPADDPVYNSESDSDYVTDGNGEKSISSISPGSYTFAISPLETNYELFEINPASSFDLPAGGNLPVSVKLANKNAQSLIVEVLGSSDAPISGASVHLTLSGYNETQTTPSTGKVFFPVSSDPFSAGTYDLEITATGYQPSNTQTTIISNELKIETIKLTI